MAHRISLKTTFEPENVISPLYTGGSVGLSDDGRVLATCLGEDVLLTDLTSGERLAHIEGDGEVVTTLALTPSASHLIICSRSLFMRIYDLDRSSSPSHITATLSRTLKPHTSPVVTSAIDHTSTLVATGGADGIVKIWDIRGGYTTHTLHGHSGVISALHFFEIMAYSKAHESPHTSKKKKKKRKQSDVDTEQEPSNEDGNEGFRLASGSEDGKIRIWNLQKRKCAAVLDSHVSVIRGLDFDMEENILLSGSRDKTIILWDAMTWKVRNTIPVLEVVEATGFLKQRSFVYTGGELGRLRLWDSKTGLEVTEEQARAVEGQSILDIIYASTLSFLLTVHSDQNLQLHSVHTLNDLETDTRVAPLPILRQISGTHDEVIDLAYLGSNQSLLAVATNLEDIRILSLKQSSTAESLDSTETLGGDYFGADVGVLKGHDDIIICLDVDWSGHWLATGAKDNTARLWRIDPQTKSFTSFAIFSGHAESLGAVALPKTPPPNGSSTRTNPLDHPPPFVLTGSQDKTIKRWDTAIIQSSAAKAIRATYTRKAHDRDINALDISHDSRYFASASQDRTVKIWSLEDGEPVGVLRGHKRGVWTVKFSPRDTQSISSDTGSQASSARGLVLTGSGDKTVKIWNLADYSCLRTFEGHTNSVLKVVWMNPPSTGRSDEDVATSTKQRPPQVASAGSDGLVKVWDAATGELACTLDNHTDRVWALTQPQSHSSSSTQSSTTLVSGGGDGVITFWKDTTSATLSAATAVSTARIEQDQRLQNLIRAGSYREAIVLALALDHPARLLGLFKSVVNAYPQEEGSVMGIKAVDEVLGSLGDEQLWKLLGRCREWNSNARTAWIAQKVLGCVLRSYPAGRITGLRAPKGVRSGVGGVKEVLEGLRAYTERHYRRVEELVDESFLVEYTLREMDEVLGVPVGVETNGNNGTVIVNGHDDGDVIMV